MSIDLRISRRGFWTGMAASATFASCANVALAGTEKQTIPSYFSIPVEIGAALGSQSIIGDPWACSVSAEIADQIGFGAQIRICRGGDHCAVYTITEVRESDPEDTIRLGKSARERLGTTSKSFDGIVRPALATEQLSDSEAKDADEFVERIQDSGNHQGLVVIAPHGGAIELNTDRQARRVADLLSGADVSTWCCNGWKKSGGAWDRWHVTSTLISPQSFPGLAALSKRDFAYAVAFHGMKDDGVLIGGAGPKQLKNMLRSEIKAALGGGAGPVTIASSGNEKGGASSDNVTNWLTAGYGGGIQIEQSLNVRKNYWKDVAAAVASVYSGLV